MVYNLHFSSSKCSLFHNSNLFGSCIIHILYTGGAKIKKIIPAPKGYGVGGCLCTANGTGPEMQTIGARCHWRCHVKCGCRLADIHKTALPCRTCAPCHENSTGRLAVGPRSRTVVVSAQGAVRLSKPEMPKSVRIATNTCVTLRRP